MILPTPTDKAEAALLGRILLDEEDRAHGRRHGPRLLEQVRRWGITSAGLFGRGYHAELWSRIQEVAARGEHATRPAVHSALLEATDDEPAPDEPPAPHPETAAVTHLITSAETVLDEVGIDPPELDRPLGEAYVPETEREELGVPTARVSEEELTAAEEAELSRRG